MPDRIDVVMDTGDSKTRKNLSIAIALLVGIPLFMLPTFIGNGYEISNLVLVTITTYCIVILFIIIKRHKRNIRGDTNRNIERRDI
jgi:glycerol-3-phosphate acyltransferase PlsY